MKIDNEFVVPAPVDRVWAYLLDVEKIAPCAPGAELGEVVDDRTWKGKMNVKVGPVAMSFAGTVTLQERDDAVHRAILKAEGREQRGRGAASAIVTSWLEEVEGGTRVSISTDLTISGAAAQYGRGMIGDVSKRLTGEFASCLQASMGARGSVGGGDSAGGEPRSSSDPAGPVAASAGASTPAAAKPVKGFRLAVWALWRALVRAFRRLFG
ncbi:MAG TPA: SRPBCC family protein [Actinomycetota bacterium]|nr:SRPBCC family protein [Actinomycetota bacterium]